MHTQEDIKRWEDIIKNCLPDSDYNPKCNGPFTWSVSYWDGTFVAILDENNKPLLTNGIRDPEDAAALVNLLNRLGGHNNENK